MPDDDLSSTEVLAPIREGNDLFQAAVPTFIALEPTFAAHLLRDRLRRAGVSIRTVTVADLGALLPDLEQVLEELAGASAGKTTVALLRGLVERR